MNNLMKYEVDMNFSLHHRLRRPSPQQPSPPLLWQPDAGDSYGSCTMPAAGPKDAPTPPAASTRTPRAPHLKFAKSSKLRVTRSRISQIIAQLE